MQAWKYEGACVLAALSSLWWGCEAAPEREGGAAAVTGDVVLPDAEVTDVGASDGEPPDVGRPFVAVSFNTGSAPELDHGEGPEDGYGQAQAEVTDAWYGNGLAWTPFVEGTARWFAEVQPDVVAFQEIFHPGDCADIPDEARAGFVCEAWAPGDATVVQRVVGEGWQVACHPGKPDKCLAVRSSWGRIRGCDASLCLEGLEGAGVEGCGRGARVAWAVVELSRGGALTVVSVHGTSGFDEGSMRCRVAQAEQALAAATEGPALVLGDLNTDPGRAAAVDPSAALWAEGGGDGLRFISDVGRGAEPTYAGLFNIDHALGRGVDGVCASAGVVGGPRRVLDAVFFDHAPLVCTLSLDD